MSVIIDGLDVRYIEAKGKDVSFERWRVELYYDLHLARVKFFQSELAYQVFLAVNQPKCFSEYGEYVSSRRFIP